MSRANLETVQRLIEAHERRDFDAVFDLYDPQVVYRTDGFDDRLLALGIDPIYVGHEGVRKFWREWLAAWETIDFEYQEFIDAGDRVLVVLSARLRGRTSGVELNLPSYVQMWTVRKGKVLEMEFFPSRAEALEIVGLS